MLETVNHAHKHLEVVLLEEVLEGIEGRYLPDVVLVLIVDGCLKISREDRVAPHFAASRAIFLLV